MQQRMDELNPGWAERHADVATRPDGDVELDETADFVVPACDGCGGMLKPDVVFFGENVPAPRVERCYAAVEALGEQRRRAAGGGVVADGDERAAVREAGGQVGAPRS